MESTFPHFHWPDTSALILTFASATKGRPATKKTVLEVIGMCYQELFDVPSNSVSAAILKPRVYSKELVCVVVWFTVTVVSCTELESFATFWLVRTRGFDGEIFPESTS